jgi:hypothetical protein
LSGCTDKVTRGTFRVHIEKCAYSPAHCPYGETDCVAILKKDLNNHLQMCNYRPISCLKCAAKLLFFQLDDHFANECIASPIPCEDCKEEILRKDLNKHFSLCPEKLLPCTYFSRGCSFVVRKHFYKFSKNRENLHKGRNIWNLK